MRHEADSFRIFIIDKIKIIMCCTFIHFRAKFFPKSPTRSFL